MRECWIEISRKLFTQGKLEFNQASRVVSLFNSLFPITRSPQSLTSRIFLLDSFPIAWWEPVVLPGLAFVNPLIRVRVYHEQPGPSNPSVLAATFLIRVRNLAETPWVVTTTAIPRQAWSETMRNSLETAARLWFSSTLAPHSPGKDFRWFLLSCSWTKSQSLSNVLGWRVSSDTRPLRWSPPLLLLLFAPVSIISGMVLFTGISQSTIWLTFYPHLPVC